MWYVLVRVILCTEHTLFLRFVEAPYSRGEGLKGLEQQNHGKVEKCVFCTENDTYQHVLHGIMTRQKSDTSFCVSF